MADTSKPSTLERVAGSKITQFGSTAVAIFAGVPAAFLPMLSSWLATGRHAERIEAELRDLNERLSRLENVPPNPSDSQIKIVGECAVAILSTTDDRNQTFILEINFKFIS